MSFIYAFLIICVAVLSFLSFYFWQQSRSAAAVLKEGARRYNELLQHRKAMANESESLRIQLKKMQSDLDTTEKQLSHSRRKISEQDMEITKHHTAISSFQNLNEHLSIQVEALTGQIKELEHQLHHQSQPQVQKQAIHQLEEKYKKTNTDYQNAVQKISELEKNYGKANLEELRAYKKRCSQFNRMYHGMRSLKEMAEQKSENFEAALLHLSRYVLTQNKKEATLASGKFGEIVGEALETTGGSFVEAHSDDDAHHDAYEA